MGSVTTPVPLRRRNSISSVVPIEKLEISAKKHSSSFPAAGYKDFPITDVELVSFKSPAYTSLKDLIPSLPPAGLQSPNAGGSTQSFHEISIRNRLVKHAAWAYLQPMAASPDASGSQFFRQFWIRFSGECRNKVSGCLGFIKRYVIPTIARAFDRILGIIIWVGRRRSRR